MRCSFLLLMHNTGLLQAGVMNFETESLLSYVPLVDKKFNPSGNCERSKKFGKIKYLLISKLKAQWSSLCSSKTVALQKLIKDW